MLDDGLGAPLDPVQLGRIEAVHRGFFYQHLYAVGCLLWMSQSGAEQVLIERDEDVEVVLETRRVYVQVKTRIGTLGWSDISGAVARFAELRDEHVRGHRVGSPAFAVVSNAAPGPALMARMGSPSWPNDVVVLWPGGPGQGDYAALPPPWADIPEGLRWCAEAAGEIPFVALSAETLVLKLAARVAHAAAGGDEHRFVAADLAGLFEQLVEQLQDFPAPPTEYRAQENEPALEAADRVRLVVGFSGAGKTAWASQAALHSPSRVAYFDVGDLPGTAVATSLARELAARFLDPYAGGRHGAQLPAGSGLEVLRAIDRRLTAEGASVMVVLDNAHRLDAAAVRAVVEAAAWIRFVMLGQPTPEVHLVEAQLRIRAETLDGWPLDAISAEFKAQGSPIDASTASRVRSLTSGMPLFVQNAALLTKEIHSGDAAGFLAAVEGQLHMTATAQEVILTETFEQLSADASTAAALLGLANVPLTSDEVFDLLGTAIDNQEEAADAVRELFRHGLVQAFLGGRQKLHDACRPSARSRLRTLGTDTADRARTTLRDLLFDSLQQERDLSRFDLWMRLLPQTGREDVLIDLATHELFHEFGDPSALRAILEAAANSASLEPEDRFWALDALAFWDYQDDRLANMPDRVNRMASLVERHGFGPREQLALRMKQMSVAAEAGDLAAIDAAFTAGVDLAGRDPMFLRALRYNRATALYHIGAFAAAENTAWDLVQEYYEHVGLDPVSDVLAKNPDEIRARLQDTPTIEDDLKHLADCLDLYALARRQRGESSGFALLHAMKFYLMSGALRSAAHVGQDVVDEFLDRGDVEGARQVMEGQVLPLLRAFPLVELLVPIRAQYAVVLAWSGDADAARAEMTSLQSYDLSPAQKLELAGQRKLIEQIAAGQLQLP